MDISFTVCNFVCLFVSLRISPLRIKLAASNFAGRCVGILGRKSTILGNFAPPEAQNRTSRPARDICALGCHGAGDAGVRTGHA